MARSLDKSYHRFSLKPLASVPLLFSLLIFVLFLFPILVFPIVSLTGMAFGELQHGNFIFSPYLLNTIEFSLIQSFLSTLLSAVLGVGVALYVIENGRGRGSWIWRLSLISFSLPSLVVVLALLSFWGREGLGFSIFGYPGILLCHVAMNYPVFMKLVGESWLASGVEEECTALSLGAGRFRTFVSVTFPKLKSSLFKAGLLCFTYCFCSFIPVAVLGGNPSFSTIELGIYQALKFENNLSKAAVLSLLQLILLFPLFLAFQRTQKNKITATFQKRIQIFQFSKTTSWIVWVILGAIVIGISFGPLVLVVAKSVFAFESQLSEIWDAFLNSAKLAGLCVMLVLPVGFAGAYLERHFKILSPFIPYAMVVPLFIPVMFLTAAFSGAFPELIESFRDSFWAVAVIQMTIALPLVYRSLLSGFESIPRDVEWVAISLGASQTDLLRDVEIPLLRRFIFLAIGLAICFSLGEVSSLLLFGSSQGATLSLLVFQKLGKYAVQDANLVAGVLICLMALILWSIEKCNPS